MQDRPLHTLAQDVLAHLRQRRWLKPGDRLAVAVSGGADSVALLRALLELNSELGIVLSVAHFNHTLRGDESEADHEFVKNLARAHSLELHDARGDVALLAKQESLSTEASARAARYEFFWSLIEHGRVDKIATAHTLDDQAETVLLRLIRGTGTRGLGGIQPQLTGPLARQTSRGAIIRPLLHIRRQTVEGYLTELGQPWREDSSNRDLHHTRNRVRQRLIPLLEKDFNPEITERLADFAEIAQAEEAFWDQELRRHLTPNPLQRNALLQLPLALQRRLVRAVTPPGLQLEFRQVESILEVAAGANGFPTTCNLADGWTFRRSGDSLAFVAPTSREDVVEDLQNASFGILRLPVPGQAAVPGTGIAFEAVRILLNSPPAGYNPEHLYAPHTLPSELVVRTWRFGDRFWPAHTKAPKKLKELFQARKVPAELRGSWPVMVTERDGCEEVVWVQGFAAPAHLRPGPGDREAILLREHADKANGV
jgi:tRNA(Ile)-lysidine synthase